jgi:hypothetical protein
MRWKIALWGLLVIAAGVIHFGNTSFFAGRKLIDYDDLSVIKPLLSMDLKTYFSERLPNRSNYAFPLTDLSIFADRALSAFTPGQSFWLTQFVLFALTLIPWMLTIGLFSPSLRFTATVSALSLSHPANVEVLQWVTCRKYTMQGIFLAWGAFLALKIFRAERLPKTSEWTLMFLLWISAQLCYPNAILWLPWVVVLFGSVGLLPKKNFIIALAGVSAFAVLSFYLTARGSGSWTDGTLAMFTHYPNFEKGVFFGIRAVGRGTFNLLLPFWPAPYYDEQSALTWIGWLLLGALATVFFRVLRKRPIQNDTAKNGHQNDHRQLRRDMAALLSLCLAILIPVANTILPFPDFMLADRHFYLVIPYVTLLIALCLRVIPSIQKILPWVAGVFCLLTARASFNYAPLWADNFDLMTHCARNEKSARCISQAIRHRFFAGRCSDVSDMFQLAIEHFPHRSPYTAEFSYEVPTFHSACLGLAKSLTSEKKLAGIQYLSKAYSGIDEIAIGRVLTHLQDRRYEDAWKVARQYYLNDIDHGPMTAVYSVISIYAGQLKALCKINPTQDCLQVRDAYLNFHKERILRPAAFNWGYRITMLAATGKEQ